MDVFRLLISFYDQITNDKTNLSPSYYLKICHCLYNVGDSERFVSIFESLLGIPRRPQNSENAIPMDSASERNSQSENSNMKLKPLLEVEDFPSEVCSCIFCSSLLACASLMQQNGILELCFCASNRP